VRVVAAFIFNISKHQKPWRGAHYKLGVMSERSALRFAVADFRIKIEIHTAQTGFLGKNITVSSRYTCREQSTENWCRLTSL
jgi:hypothetical protein